MPVGEHTITLDRSPVFYRSAPAPSSSRSAATPLYLHGAPTSSADWVALLERTGGIAPDLLGFGRSGKGGHLDLSPAGLARFLIRVLDALELERVSVVGHDWGAAVGVLLADGAPERVQRLALVNAVPLLEGFQWPRIVRIWRHPVIGELVMGSIPRRAFARGLRGAAATAAAWPPERVEEAWQQFDQGTQRALIRLSRTTGEHEQQAFAAALARLSMPVLIAWGDADPWTSRALAEAYAQRIPRAQLELISGAGHWPWLDDNRAIELIAGFLEAA